MARITLADLRELKQIVQAAQGQAWDDRGHGYRTEIGFWTRDIDQHDIFVPLFETRTSTRRADVLAVIHAHNRMLDLIEALERELTPVDFKDAVRADPDMTPEQKAKWLRDK